MLHLQALGLLSFMALGAKKVPQKKNIFSGFFKDFFFSCLSVLEVCTNN